MTVAYVVSMKGGLPSYVLSELRELERIGFSFHLYATKRTRGPYDAEFRWKVTQPNPVQALLDFWFFLFASPAELLRATIEASKGKTWTELGVALQFARVMRRDDTRWIHAHFGDRKALVAYLCGLLLRIPHSVTIHAHELYDPVRYEVRRRAFLAASKIVTVCHSNETVLIRDWKLPREKVLVSRLVLGAEHLRLERRAKMLAVGNFVEKKGYDTLFSALRAISSSQLVTWVVGTGSLDIRTLAEREGVADRIIFLGEVSADLLHILYDACDFFCMASQTSRSGEREGFPMALAEALAHGKPVVATRHSGIPEIVEEILVPEGEPAALANGIMEMIRRRAEWQAMGRRNRDLALEHFSARNVEALVRTFGVAP